MTRLSNKLVSSRKNGSKSASNRNDNNKPNSQRNNVDGKVNGFDIGGNGMKHTKMSRKLSKSRKLKSKKISKS